MLFPSQFSGYSQVILRLFSGFPFDNLAADADTDDDANCSIVVFLFFFCILMSTSLPKTTTSSFLPFFFLTNWLPTPTPTTTQTVFKVLFLSDDKI